MVADPYIATPELREASAEKLVILPDCYQCNDDARKIAQRVPDRAEHGLPHDGFVFASFNVTRKINPEVFDVWMRILRQVDGSVLWLLTNSEEAKENLRTEASRRAVAPERLVFAQRTTPDEHLARLRLADLHIDTFPYSAHTTASDALWAGCPILTRTGRGFPSRVCASLLSTIGVPELITTSWQEYEGLALTLARDRQMLDGLRSRIVEGSKTSPLFDTSRYCRNLEAAYQEMVRIAASGGQAAEIDVRALRG
jgi:predicted O-linked N-acetylglucosamine transferase (SPINDLY family)